MIRDVISSELCCNTCLTINFLFSEYKWKRKSGEFCDLLLVKIILVYALDDARKNYNCQSTSNMFNLMDRLVV